ncbi:tyrosine--tRNA ligase, partial [bacterium]|nr:tyrosine--tRNA ligase [bacterium]
VNGIELTRRTDQKSVYGLTTNLLTTSSGAKMGKTAQGAVWLNEDMLSVYDYWQFWRNTEDADIGRFLRLFTELPLDEIARLEALEGADLNEAKKVLATQATAMCHGLEAAQKAEATALETFEGGGTSEDLPSMDIDVTRLKQGLGLLEAFVIAGLANTNSEARRLLQGGGARLNGAPQKDINLVLSEADIVNGSIKLSAGKKRHVLLRPASD